MVGFDFQTILWIVQYFLFCLLSRIVVVLLVVLVLLLLREKKRGIGSSFSYYYSYNYCGREEGMRGEREREEERTSRSVFMVVLAVCIGDFMFGYDTGVIGGALLFIVPAFELENTPIKEGFIVSSTLITAAICSAACAPIMDKFGRKVVIIAAGILLSCGCLIMAFAWHYFFLVFGRAVIGCGIGILSAAIPLYISEMAPPHWRGFLVGMSQLLVSLGILSSYLVNFLLALFLEESNPNLCWKLMLGVSIIPALLQLVLAFLIPESPCWLIKKGRIREAGEVLLILHEKTNIEKEMIEAYETAGVPVPEELHLPREIETQRSSLALIGSSYQKNDELKSNPFTSPTSLPPTLSTDDSSDENEFLAKNGRFLDGTLTIGGGKRNSNNTGDNGNNNNNNEKKDEYSSINSTSLSSSDTSQSVSGWEEEGEEERGAMRGMGGYRDYYNFTSSVVKKGLFLGIGIQIFQQITGINAVVYYTPTILDVAGVNIVFMGWGLTNDQSSLLATLFVYIPKIPCIYVALKLVDRAGRRLLLLPTIFTMFICLIGLSLSFALFLEQDSSSSLSLSSLSSLSPTSLSQTITQAITNQQQEEEGGGVIVAIFCMIFVSVYGCVFSMGLGPLAGVLCSEIFPMEVRARAMGICIAIQWSCNILVSQFFPALAGAIGQGGAFALFAGMCVFAFFWVLLFVPETKKKSIAEIIQLLVPWPYRIDQPF